MKWNINVIAAHIYREKKSWNKSESLFINMPKNVRFYRKNDHPKVYISFCNIVL